jgi:hypothetical protein
MSGQAEMSNHYLSANYIYATYTNWQSSVYPLFLKVTAMKGLYLRIFILKIDCKTVLFSKKIRAHSREWALIFNIVLSNLFETSLLLAVNYGFIE